MPTEPPVPSNPPRHQSVFRREELCDSFEATWKAGTPAPLEDLLAQVPEQERPDLLEDLLALECEYRARQECPVTPTEARQRFGSLGPWVAEVLARMGLEEKEGEPLTLEVLEGPLAGQSFQLRGHTTFLVGRGPGVHLALEGDPHLSRAHFCIEYNPPRARLVDLRSKNGTALNGKKVPEADLRDSDLIRAGRVLLRVKLQGGEGTVTLDRYETISPADPVVSLVKPTLPLPVVPGYVLEEELGRGGMGVVYRARVAGETGPRRVALKTVLPAVAPRPETVGRFQREVTILERLDHPNIVKFHETGVAGGLLFFVMEFVPGASASEVVKKGGPLPAERVVALGCQLLDALGYAHGQGFVHRDVKPSNLLLAGPDREVLKLADFGLARTYQASALSGLTVSGTSGGTPEFMPPEQVTDFRTARPTADLYAVAASLYYLLTGQHVYERANSTMEMFLRILQTEPIPLRQPTPGSTLPAGLTEVIKKALARDPAQRYPDARTMRSALARAL